MSHAAPHVSSDAILKDLASKLPVQPNARKRMIWMVCMAIGVVAFAYLLFTQPLRAWGSYAINMVFWLGIAQGAVVLSCAVRLANGRWAGPIQRTAESLSAYLPYGIATVALMLVAGVWTYLPWVKEVEPRQAPYLNVPFLWIRALGGLALLWWLNRKLVALTLRTDAHLLRGHVPAELKPTYEKLAAGWKGDDAEAAIVRDRSAMLAPQIVLAYAVVFTLLAWDWIMSLTPDWVSQIFGWWFFMGAFLTGVAMTAFFATQVRAKYRLEDYITPNHFWDVGKILFGFSIFWVYQFWSQYLPIWYANLPEETWWVFLRFEEPWRPLAFTVFTMVFLLPFLGLMNMYTKKNPFWLATFSLIVLAGMWLERHLLVMPSLEPGRVWLGLPEIGVGFGFMGLFGWAVQSFVTKFPVVRVSDALAPPGGHGH
jgi:hypothetical protein